MSNAIVRGSLAGAALLVLGGLVPAQERLPQPETYCVSTPNSFTRGAEMGWLGHVEISRNDFALVVSGAVPQSIGIFLWGSEAQRLPFGSGYLCIASPVHRLDPPQIVSDSGHAIFKIDFRDDFHGGMFAPGTSCNFQFLYRDGTRFNLSNGLRVPFAR